MFEKIGKLETDPNKKMNQEVPKNQHEIWKKTWGESYVIKDCLSHDDLEWLTDLMYRRHHKRRVRECGTLHYWVDNETIQLKFYDKLKEHIPELDANSPWEGNYVITSTPYNLHIDTGRADWVMQKECIPGKQLVIPLFACHINKEFKGTDKIPPCGIATFKNRFIRYGTNFSKTSEKYETDVFDTVCNYNTLECFNIDGSKWEVDWNKPFDSKLREKYFTHYKKEWLDGFELENIFNYNRGDVVVFDRSQAHSGIDFMKHQITMKGMLSLMTTISHV
jgi:hypothetical protein